MIDEAKTPLDDNMTTVPNLQDGEEKKNDYPFNITASILNMQFEKWKLTANQNNNMLLIVLARKPVPILITAYVLMGKLLPDKIPHTHATHTITECIRKFKPKTKTKTYTEIN